MSGIDLRRIGLHAGTLRQVPGLAQKAQLAKQAGFAVWALRGVEVEAHVAEGRTIDDVRRLNDINGLAVSELGSFMQWQFTGGIPLINTFTRPDGVSDGELLERADRMLHWTRALGCDLVAAIAAYEADGPVEDGARDFRRVCGLAARHGVRVGLEVLGFAPRFNTLQQAWEVVERAGCDNGGILLDTFHFYRGGSTLEMLDAIPGEKLYLVHLCDVPPVPRDQARDDGRLPPGEGACPLRQIVARVVDKGYPGYFVIEVLSQELWRRDPLEVARRCYDGAVEVLNAL